MWEEFSNSPVLGWMKDLSSALPITNTQPKLTDSITTTQLSTDLNLTLQEFVEESSEQIVLE